MELIESTIFYAPVSTHAKETILKTVELEMPDDVERFVPLLEDSEEISTAQLADEGYKFRLAMELPKSLTECRQSVETQRIRIIHRFKTYVNLLNPEGHTSQLVIKNQLNLYISPNAPPGEDQTIPIDYDRLDTALRYAEANRSAPPTYGLHQLDELYDGIDPAGFQSRVISAAVTPFATLSRSASFENLPSLPTTPGFIDASGASAVQLHSRLVDLHLNQQDGAISTNSDAELRNASVSTDASPPRSMSVSPENLTPGNDAYSHANSNPSSQSRRSSQEDAYLAGSLAAQHIEYDMDALARTPSYNTAVRTPVLNTPDSSELPTYEIAISRPASPERRVSWDTLREETQRNTLLNSRRGSLRGTPSEEVPSTVR
jgi:arrestin-related trafficking adapter 4/5/7